MYLKSEPRTLEFYKKHPRVAFQEGHPDIVKSKRHWSHHYKRYSYYMPEPAVSCFSILKKYFKELDYKYEKIPNNFKYRQTFWDLTETALDIMWTIRLSILRSNPIFAGTEFISPISWAIFGSSFLNETHSRTARKYFPTMSDVFSYYDASMWSPHYNIGTIDRAIYCVEDKEQDSLLNLSSIYGKSPNYTLSCAYFLLFDIIKNCGPDCPEFFPVFTNDLTDKSNNPSITANWNNARKKISHHFRSKNSSSTEIISEFKSISTEYNKTSHYEWKCKKPYYIIVANEINKDSIIDGEKYESYEDCKFIDPAYYYGGYESEGY